MKRAGKKRNVGLVMLVVLACAALSGCGSKENVGNTSRNGVVRVLAQYTRYISQWNPQSGEYQTVDSDRVSYTGSAFGVGSAGKMTDTFVTNRHVVAGSILSYEDGQYYKDEYEFYEKLDSVYILKDDYAISGTGTVDTSRAVPCDVIYCADEDDPDLAILKAAEKVEGRVALSLLSKKGSIDAGDKVYALGYPGSTDDINTKTAASVERVTVTDGIVSLHSSYGNTRIIQHTARINHGNSGGPLINENGAVVGVNTIGWGQDDSTGDSGSYGSIEIDYVRDILEDQDIAFDVYKKGSPVWIVLLIVLIVVVLLFAVAQVLRHGRKGTSARDPEVYTQGKRLADESENREHREAEKAEEAEKKEKEGKARIEEKAEKAEKEEKEEKAEE